MLWAVGVGKLAGYGWGGVSYSVQLLPQRGRPLEKGQITVIWCLDKLWERKILQNTIIQ